MSLNYEDNNYSKSMVYNIKVIVSSLFIAFGGLFYLYYNFIDYFNLLYTKENIEGFLFDYKYAFIDPPLYWLYFVGHIPDIFFILILIPTCLIVKKLIKVSQVN